MLNLPGHTSEVTCLYFSSNGTSLFSGSLGSTVHVWNLNSASEVAKLRGHKTTATCVYGEESNPNMVVTGSEDTNIKLWDVRLKSNNNCTMTFTGHTSGITCL